MVQVVGTCLCSALSTQRLEHSGYLVFVFQVNEEVNPVITLLIVSGKPRGGGGGGTLTQGHRIYTYMSPDPHSHPDLENCAIPFPITCCPSAHTHTDTAPTQAPTPPWVHPSRAQQGLAVCRGL